jgi:2-polyprenyl-3-methyl-5-hydroxy-6-metoxy-1,4-benzoquinol methylase
MARGGGTAANAVAKGLESRIGRTAAIKSRVRRVMERTGFWLVRVGPVERVHPVLYTAAELEQLDRDLEGLRINDRDYEVFTSADAIRGYLDLARINFYHQLIATCEKEGLSFEGKRVMEVGVGAGYLLRLLSDKIGDGSLHGSDYYEELTRIARGLAPKANIFQASMRDLESSSERYDVVICTETLEHILDTETPIPTLLGLLATGGALVLTVPNVMRDFTPPLGSDDGNSYVGHVNFWTKESWRFYIQRLVGARRFVTGSVGGRYVDESHYAIIFAD